MDTWRPVTLSESYQRPTIQGSQTSVAPIQRNRSASPPSPLNRPLSFERPGETSLNGSVPPPPASPNVNNQATHQSQNSLSTASHSPSPKEENRVASKGPVPQRSLPLSSGSSALGARPNQKQGSRANLPPRKRWENLKQAAAHPWLLEIASCLLACISFMAIISTLAVHQGRPLPEWPDLISINSLLAIFNTVLKGCLVMPVAEGMYCPQRLDKSSTR